MQWQEFIEIEKKKPYFINLQKFIDDEYEKYSICPAKENLYKAFDLCSFDSTLIVFLGQDPYHTKGVANGLAFSVQDGKKIPPSLKNIFKEIKIEYPHFEIPKTGNLEPYAKQGVLFLNTCLTVREGFPNSHAKKGWEIFTDNVIKYLNENKDSICFVLLGNNAKRKRSLISKKHLIIEAAHPSPLSAYRGFFNSDVFKKINAFYYEKTNNNFNFEL